jgi:hypothetical protein
MPHPACKKRRRSCGNHALTKDWGSTAKRVDIPPLPPPLKAQALGEVAAEIVLSELEQLAIWHGVVNITFIDFNASSRPIRAT